MEIFHRYHQDGRVELMVEFGTTETFDSEFYLSAQGFAIDYDRIPAGTSPLIYSRLYKIDSEYAIPNYPTLLSKIKRFFEKNPKPMFGTEPVRIEAWYVGGDEPEVAKHPEHLISYIYGRVPVKELRNDAKQSSFTNDHKSDKSRP